MMMYYTYTIVTSKLINISSPHIGTISVCVMSAPESTLLAYFHCSIQYY